MIQSAFYSYLCCAIWHSTEGAGGTAFASLSRYIISHITPSHRHTITTSHHLTHSCRAHRSNAGLRLALLRAAEEAKQKLTSQDSISVILPGSTSATSSTEAAQLSISKQAAEATWQPLLTRLWTPLEEVAYDTRTQYQGSLPSMCSTSSRSTSSSTGSTDSWSYSVFPVPAAAGATKKYVAPPRKLTGIVLVGAATRMPCVRDFIQQVRGMMI